MTLKLAKGAQRLALAFQCEFNRLLHGQSATFRPGFLGVASSPNALTLIADGNTHQWAELDSEPIVFHALEGNFETQVKVVFKPMWGHELAALGVRSTRDHHTWLRLGTVYTVFSAGSEPEQHIVLDIDNRGKGGKIRTSPYPANPVYLKIERQGPVFDFSYSSNGIDWIALQRDYVAEMPANVKASV